MNSRNDSCKDGRDSWLVNFLLGKIEEVVMDAKSRRQAAEVLPDLEQPFSPGSARLKRGVGQQPERHT